MDISYSTMRVNGIDLHVAMAGSGTDVLLLHGFPDTHLVWREQIPALVAAGHRVIAPDLRGCGQSSMPPRVRDYRLDLLVDDIVGLLDALGIAKVRLVAHDWGAVIGWQLALRHPGRIERYCALSVGHPSCYARGGLLQKLKAYYIALFQLPLLPELILRFGNWRGLYCLTRCRHELATWRQSLSPPGRLRAGINYYRANLGLVWPHDWGDVLVPVLGIYSTGDIALVERQMVASGLRCKAGWRYVRFERAGHWMQSEIPDRLNPVLLSFLK